MNKDELIRAISEETGYTVKDSETFLNAIISIFRNAIKNRTQIAVRGFGQLQYRVIKAHEGVKPTKGVKGQKEKIDIPQKGQIYESF